MALKRKFLLSVFIGIFSFFVPSSISGFLIAQADDNPDALEGTYRMGAVEGISEWQAPHELLVDLSRRPLDLNRANMAELMDLGMVSALEAAQFLAYRQQCGRLVSIYELQAVPGWSISLIRMLLPYCMVGDTTPGLKSLAYAIRNAEQEFIGRVNRGFPAYVSTESEGGPWGVGIRYRGWYGNQLRYGFTTEKDPGEATFRGSNQRGLDFFSVHLGIQHPYKRVRQLCLGDYSASLGQGLLLQTGFSPGKSAETTAIMRGAGGIRPYASFGEAYFLRGGGATMEIAKRIGTTVFYSGRCRDANVLIKDSLGASGFSSFQYSGLHRTVGEIEDERAVQEHLVGFNLQYMGLDGQLGINGLHFRFDKPWIPAAAPYRKFSLRGDQFTALSTDYRYRFRNGMYFGEVAYLLGGGLASLQGLLISADSRVTLSLLRRDYSPAYQSLYGAAIAEAGGSNEHGLYLGMDIRWIRRVQINLFADFWRHPFLRYGVESPTTGAEYLARIHWTRGKTFSMYAMWQMELKDEPVEGLLLPIRRNRFRIHLINKLMPGLEWRFRVEWVGNTPAWGKGSRGALLYQEVVCKFPSRPLYGSMRYLMFDTESYESRVYAFERDLFSSVSVPAFSGRGSRFYMNISWRVNDLLRFECRYDFTRTLRSVSDGTAEGGRSALKLQIRLSW
jgi:hypothetical protein